jgi:hypothetical protein
MFHYFEKASKILFSEFNPTYFQQLPFLPSTLVIKGMAL